MQQKNKAGDLYNVGNARFGDDTHYHYHDTRYGDHMLIPKELTLSIPRTHPADIIGRDTELSMLHALLHEQKRAVLVNALGGIGKTTFVQAYLTSYYDHYQHIVWVTQSRENIGNDFMNAAGLAKNLGITMNDADPEQVFEEMIRRLKNIPSQPNLLIIDNAEQSIRKYLNILPGQPYWHLLVTSREEIDGFHLLPLGFLNEQQAIALFRKHCAQPLLNDQEIQSLIKSVDYHTLVIEILAKTTAVKRYNRAMLMSANTYDLKANIAVKNQQGYCNVEKIGSYLQTIFNISNLSKPEIWLMKQFVCLPAGFHTYELLSDLLIAGDGAYAESFSSLLNRLVRQGWLLYHKELDSYKMHPVVKAVLRELRIIRKADIHYLLKSVTQRLLINFEKDNPIDKFVWIPFAWALYAYFGPDCVFMGTLLNNLALVLQEQGNYSEAKSLFLTSIRMAESVWGSDNCTTINRNTNLAITYQSLGDYKQAKLLLKRSARLLRWHYGKQHPDMPIVYSNLATVLINLADYATAKKLLEKAIQLERKISGECSAKIMIMRSNLGIVLGKLGNYEEAKSLHESIMLDSGKNYGEMHPNTALSYSNMAASLGDLKDYNNALLLFLKALKSDKKNFGENHPVMAANYANIGMILFETRYYKYAREVFKKSIRIHEKTLGINHPSTAIQYAYLAAILYILGDYFPSLFYAEKALNILKAFLHYAHPQMEIVQMIYKAVSTKINAGCDNN